MPSDLDERGRPRVPKSKRPSARNKIRGSASRGSNGSNGACGARGLPPLRDARWLNVSLMHWANALVMSQVEWSSLRFAYVTEDEAVAIHDLADLDVEGELKPGPSHTKVWNSPRSPQGSTPTGSSLSNSGIEVPTGEVAVQLSTVNAGDHRLQT